MKNKKKLSVLFILFTFLTFSQSNTSLRTLDNSGINPALIRAVGNGLAFQGTPYLTKSFQAAKVEIINQNALMRYNAAQDQFEFISTKGDTLALNKTQDFGDITFPVSKTRYLLKSYIEKSGRSTTGYLVLLFEKNNYMLFQRQKIIFFEAKVPKSSYDTGSPARYERAKDVFFIKIKDNEVIELPTSKKNILRMFPEVQTALETFFKQNDIDLDNDKDIIELGEFLAQ